MSSDYEDVRRQPHLVTPTPLTSSFPRLASSIHAKQPDFQTNAKIWTGIIAKHDAALTVATSESKTAAAIEKHTARQLLGKL